MTSCNASNPNTPTITCGKPKDHEAVHAGFNAGGALVEWTEPPKPKKTKAEVKIMMANHKRSLNATLQDVQGSRGVMPDVVHTVVPMLNAQLDILRDILELVEE